MDASEIKHGDRLPPCADYEKYIATAAYKLDISEDECRSRFGLFSISEWIELLHNI